MKGNSNEIGGINFTYYPKNQPEISFYDRGFDGTLDVVHVEGIVVRNLTRDSSGFAHYESLYFQVRQMATTGETK
jgi:hypothetical protein